jgi:hypothetical protein
MDFYRESITQVGDNQPTTNTKRHEYPIFLFIVERFFFRLLSLLLNFLAKNSAMIDNKRTKRLSQIKYNVTLQRGCGPQGGKRI